MLSVVGRGLMPVSEQRGPALLAHCCGVGNAVAELYQVPCAIRMTHLWDELLIVG